MSGEEKPAAVDRPERIDSTFRNGSVTAIGVVVGFSLGFLSNWASQPGDWNKLDVAAVILICIGLGLQIRALAGMLYVSSLDLAIYNRLIRFFLAGVILVAIGVGIAIFADVLGFNVTALHKP